MRTGPVELAHLGDDEATAAAARAISSLTHPHDLAADACVLWSIAIDRAVQEGRLDGIWDGLAMVPSERRQFWEDTITTAETASIESLRTSGYVVTTLQAAHWAMTSTATITGPGHLAAALRQAVAIGGDTDTIAAIVGALLGKQQSSGAERWRRPRHDVVIDKDNPSRDTQITGPQDTGAPIVASASVLKRKVAGRGHYASPALRSRGQPSSACPRRHDRRSRGNSRLRLTAAQSNSAAGATDMSDNDPWLNRRPAHGDRRLSPSRRDRRYSLHIPSYLLHGVHHRHNWTPHSHWSADNDRDDRSPRGCVGRQHELLRVTLVPQRLGRRRTGRSVRRVDILGAASQ